MKKVVIGIVAKHYKEERKRLETFIRDEVEQAIFDNDAIAIGILPPNVDKIKANNIWYDQLTTKEKHDFYDSIALCDGIILQGGGFADEYECFIAKYCHDYDIPILGICAGLQNMVKGLGGKVKKIGRDNHNSDNDYVHSIYLDETSKIYSIIHEKKIMVNSRHICCAEEVKDMNVVAYSDDNIIEIVEDPSKRFFIGVQFHPESLYKKDENMNKIFKNFIATCGEKHEDE